jgi:phosphopantothenoylcysteine decarboxylase/phosphopantothenate--cysteine ligase
LEKKRILVGITGGIAAYKVPQLIRLLKKAGAEVKAVCTPWALRFVGDETLRTITGFPVYRDGQEFYDIEHIRLAEWTDLLAICPATANTIAKMAHGIADNLLTTTAISILPEKILLAPAMNTAMWQNAATQENVAILKKRGMTMLPVGEGELACKTIGPGRMLEVEEIAGIILSRLTPEPILAGKKVLISLGPTEEPLDPVRVMTNRSSGKMGAALARSALKFGAQVVLVSGPVTVSLPDAARLVKVRTAAEMREAMLREFGEADICVMAAAVSDFRPLSVAASKIRRTEGQRLTIELAANPDILAELGRLKEQRYVVGFALETDDGEASARRKKAEKGCDMMILNKADDALEADTTRMTLFTGSEAESFPLQSKTEAADCIMRRIAGLAG